MKTKFLFSFALLWCTLFSFAQTFTQNGINYSIIDATTAAVANNINASGNITILSTVSNGGTDYTVTSIVNSAFQNCLGLTSVVIPNSVTSIGTSAFHSCENLNSVILSTALTAISTGAFISCTSLTSITIPNSVTSIGRFAFASCSGLTSVTLSTGLTTISESAFQSCVGLTSIVIPNSVTFIGTRAFQSCENLNSVVLSTILTTISAYAFQSCEKLSSIVMPNTVTSLGAGAFNSCTRLTSVVLSNAITTISSDAFQNCESLTSIVIPNTVTSIGTNAFNGCYRLSSVGLSNALTTISTAAFQYCESLTSIVIPNTVTSIGTNAFSGCINLSSLICNIVTPLSISANVFENVNQAACSLTVPAASVTAYESAPVWQGFNPISCIISENTLSVAACGTYTWSNNNETYTTSGIYTGTTTDCVTEKLDLTITDPAAFSFNNLNYVVISPTTVAVDSNPTANGIITIPASVTTTCGTYAVTRINTSAFQDCPDLTSITIPNSVTSIEASAFQNCLGLTSVVIPNSVTSIGDYAFYNSSSITSITIGNSVISIGNGAFLGCFGLLSVAIPNSVTSIGSYAFKDCYGLTSLTISNSVTSIADGTFHSCYGLTSLTIPNSVTSIAYEAFLGCSGLTSLTIPNSVTSIGSHAFVECTSLTTVTIPNSVTSIDQYTFYGCSSLTSLICNIATPLSIVPNVFENVNQAACSLTVPSASVTAYQAAPVWQGFNISCIISENTLSVVACGTYTWSNNNQTYTTSGIYTGTTTDCVTEKLNLTITTPPTNFSFNNINYAVTSPTTVAVGSNPTANGIITIPASVTTTCGTYAVTRINSSAFQDCSDLTSITIPNSVTSIEASAFRRCSSLTSVALSTGLITIVDRAFQDCSGLTSIAIPNSVTSLGSAAFSGCIGLTSATLSTGLTTIQNLTFNNCSALTSIAIPNSVTTIRPSAFLGCSGLTSVSLSSALITIFTSAFQNCTSLTSIVLPNTVTSLGISAFQGCSQLSSATLSNGLTTISSNCFQNCTSLTSITIPNAVTSIGTSAFNGCTSLTAAALSSALITIPASAFERCSVLASITIPNSVTTLGASAFLNCTGLTTATLSTDLTTFSSGAFQGCSSLTSIVIPNSLTVLGASAFQNCSALTSVVLSNALTTISTGAFQGCSSLISVVLPNTVTSTGAAIFSGCSSLSSVVLSTALTTISTSFFQNCTSLTSIVIPNSITSLGFTAFKGCESLTSVTLPTGLTIISNGAFQDCRSLTSIVIPNGVVSIGNSAFQNCIGLISLTLPHSVNSISDNAFYDCPSLASVVCNRTSPLSISANVFENVNQGLCSLTVPATGLEAYKSADVWRNFSPITYLTTYTTSWDNDVPTADASAVIAGDYTGSFDANNLTVNAGTVWTVSSGLSATIARALVNNGVINLQNNAKLSQTDPVNTNSGSGTFIVNRESNALKRLDYTLWSSPVTGAQTLAEFSPLTTTSPVRFYTYDANRNLYTAADISNPFEAGRGYLIRMPNENPADRGHQTPYALRNETLIYNGVFTGTPNNGTIDLGGLEPEKFYAVGNPYPSPISADAFLDGNQTGGTLYFWRKSNGVAGTAYATYTYAGGTGTSAGESGLLPNDGIQVGQGFIVKTAANGTSLSFTNAMRITDNKGNQFFKTKKETKKSRIWLNLTNTQGAFSQTMIAYMDGATLGVDHRIDGKYINDSKIALTSNIDGAEYAIQGRPAFDVSDVVSLNFKTDEAGNYSIALGAVDGLFAAEQEVYLIDNLMGVATNLKASAYTFAATVGEAKDRFSLKYQKNLTVAAAEFNDGTVTVFKNNKVLTVNSTSKAIKTVQVYDVQGRLIAQQKNINATKASFNNLKTASQVLIVKVIADDNTVLSKKVLN